MAISTSPFHSLTSFAAQGALAFDSRSQDLLIPSQQGIERPITSYPHPLPRGEETQTSGRTVLRTLFLASAFTGFSRPCISVESREMCPTITLETVAFIIASCTRVGNWVAENSANALEKVHSLGTSPVLSQPQIRNNFRSLDNLSNKYRVVGILYTAFATKARAIAARSFAFRPGSPLVQGINSSILTNSNQ
jgi:hypothetical protein